MDDVFAKDDVHAELPQRKTMVDNLMTLADRIARNREIAGLHYASDTVAGVALAHGIRPLLEHRCGRRWPCRGINRPSNWRKGNGNERQKRCPGRRGVAMREGYRRPEESASAGFTGA